MRLIHHHQVIQYRNSLAKFIENIPSDKKGHLILGLIVNPIGFLIFFKSALYGLLLCLAFHALIEVYQLITKSGKFEILDFLAGSSSAIIIYIILILT